MLESEQKFICPYCGSANTIGLDITGGSRQVLITDCEVCCRPIKLTASADAEGGVELDVQREDGE